jgi:cystathionine gamma-synthase
LKEYRADSSIETVAVHAARPAERGDGDVTPAIHVTTTYQRDADGGYSRGYSYSRDANPNRAALERGLATLEGCTMGVAFSSGSAATMALFRTALERGRILATDTCYHGTLRQLREFVPHRAEDVVLVDTTSTSAVEAAMARDVALVFVETPSNPLLGISDLAALARLADSYGALLACDNTFATPILQQPLSHGAHLVVHSSTKYIGGHSDVVGGLIVGVDEEWMGALAGFRSAAGAIPSPFDCWLLQRSLPTLPLRVRRQSLSARQIAEYLQSHDKVRVVHYPGLRTHRGHKLAGRQMSAFGGMISFQVDGGPDAAMRIAANAALFTRATSLGGIESLIEHRASIEGPGTRTPDDLLRLSIGLEGPEDLIADLNRALGCGV